MTPDQAQEKVLRGSQQKFTDSVDRGARTHYGGFPRTRSSLMHSMTLAPKSSLSRPVLYSIQYVVHYLGTCPVLSGPQLPTREAQLTAFMLTHPPFPTGLKT